MLTPSEKTNTDVSLKRGHSYSEIARDLFLWRHYFAVVELRKEVEAYVKGKDL